MGALCIDDVAVGWLGEHNTQSRRAKSGASTLAGGAAGRPLGVDPLCGEEGQPGVSAAGGDLGDVCCHHAV